jgi:nitroreductase
VRPRAADDHAGMETWDAVRARRNVREYTDEPIAREHLERILEAGRRAPSSNNWQPWDFVAVTDREQLVELAKVWQGAGHVARSAATVAMVGRQPEDEHRRDWLQYDFGQATMNMMVTAADLGIGSGHAAVQDQEQAQRVLGFPDGYWCLYLIALGYPADRPLRPVLRPNRRPFDEVVHWGRW